MPDQPITEQSPQTQNPTVPHPSSPTSVSQNTENTVYVVTAIASFGIIGCFFLPWLTFLFRDLSGFDLQKLPSDEAAFLWVIPIMAFLAVVSSITKQRISFVARIAGATPFVVLIYFSSEYNGDLLQVLKPGAYITLFLAIVLLVAPYFLKKPKQ